MFCGLLYAGVRSGGPAQQQWNGELGDALFDGLELIGGDGDPAGRSGDTEALGAARRS